MTWQLRIPPNTMNHKAEDHYLTFAKPMFDLLQDLCNVAIREGSESIVIGNGTARFSTGLQRELHEDTTLAAGYARILSGMLILLSEEIETGVLELTSGSEVKTIRLSSPDICTTLQIAP